jgi:hypothetical protein
MIAPEGVSRQSPDPAASPAPPLQWIGTLSAQLGSPTVIGQTAHGTRMVLPVVSGALYGPGISGTILPMSGDWLLVRPDGVGELNVRGTLEMRDGALIYVTYGGYVTNVPELMPRWQQGEEIPREAYSFVVTPRFETGAPAYGWLQQAVVIGVGTLIPGGVCYELYVVNA